MKRICKTFAFLLVMAIALFSFSITAGATEVSKTQDGLVASITSEKDNYKANEDIELTFKVTNTNDFAVENVSLEAIIPDGLTLKNNADTTASTVSLASGESLKLTLTAVKESSVITVPIGDSTEPNTEPQTQTQSVATETTENTTVVQTDSIQATTTKVNSATTDNTAIKTGNSMSYLLVGLICLACLAVAVISFRFRKKAVKYLSLVLCVCIAVGSVAFVGVTNTKAQETKQQISFEVSKTITVDSEHYIIQSSLIYDKTVEENNNDFENFEKVQQTTVDIEKKYLNSDGYVDYKDTQKLFEEITLYLQTQKDLGIIDYFTQGSSSIFVKMKSGINYMYIPEYKDYLSSGSEQRIITFEPIKSTFAYKQTKFIVDMGFLSFGKENLEADLIKNAELLGKESEYKYSSQDSYINEEVTISKLLNLPSNSLILFEGHGGYSEETGSVLWTDEKVNTNVTYDFGEEAIVYSKDKTIGVTYQFFEKLQNNSLENSTIYLGACCSTEDSRLADSLINKGAQNILGYSDTVSMRYEIGLRAFLLYGLTLKYDNGDSYTLKDAYNFALSNCGIQDSSEPHAYLKLIQREISNIGNLSGSVVSSDNNPLSDVRVDIYLKAESGTQYVDVVYTNDSGSFSIDLQDGSYELRFNKDGYETTSTTITISKDIMTVLKDPIIMEKTSSEKYDGKCGDNLNWLLDDNGTLIISGYGDMYDFNNVTDIPWYNKRSEITSVELIDGLTSVGDSAFWNCSNLTKIDIPNSVISIGYSAFRDCYNLKWVTISDNAKKIDGFAFEQCNNLCSVKIGYAVEEIGDSAFSECNKLESVIIPYGVKKIGNKTFYSCDNLEYIRIPSSVTEIGNNAFANIASSYNLKVYENTYAYEYATNNKLTFSYGYEPESVSIYDDNKSSENYGTIISSIKLNVGESYYLKAMAFPRNTLENGTITSPNTDFSWSISDTDIVYITNNTVALASYNDEAVIEAKSKGKTTITLKTSNGNVATCEVIVN